MKSHQRDYTALRYKRREGSYLSPVLGTERLIFEEVPQTGSQLMRILSSGREVSIPRSEFNAEFRDVESRLREMESGFGYRSIINFDTSELDHLRGQYRAMARVNERLKGGNPHFFQNGRGIKNDSTTI